jgi:glutamyl-tRNA synthetase
MSNVDPSQAKMRTAAPTDSPLGGASQSVQRPPRVRIAPSPTGDPHVGTAYIALFNYVFARRHGGTFVLRIEDTDQERSSRGSEEAILAALRWLGLSWDEGPDVGGPHGPYRQSERLDIYRRELDVLLKNGSAYRCFCTRERLDGLRAQGHFGYDGHCRDLSDSEIAEKLERQEPNVVRLRVPNTGSTTFVDGLRGEVSIENAQVDDQVLLKSDGFPTYHLANVVDDHHMGITHVIRGEEWISSTPKHVLLYRAFGWDAPEFFHLGLLRNADKSKLSKRKNPVSVLHYRSLGYMPSTFLNFLGNLGFSMPDGRERFAIEDMIEQFDWARVSAGGPVFDPVKLESFNASDLRAMDDDTLYQRLLEQIFAPERIKPLLHHVRERIHLLDDFVGYASFFFGGSLDYTLVLDGFQVPKRTATETIEILDSYLQAIEKDAEARSFAAKDLESFTRSFCQRLGWKPKELFSLLRLTVAGRTAAPPLFDTMALCGKDRCRLRLRDVIALLRELESKRTSP